MAEKVTVKSTRAMECNNNGYTIYRCEKATAADGKEFKLPAALMAPGHSYNANKVCERCGWKEVSIENCTVKTQYASYNYTGQPIEPKVVINAPNIPESLKPTKTAVLIAIGPGDDWASAKVSINSSFSGCR